MKTKLRIKQIFKLFIHSLILGGFLELFVISNIHYENFLDFTSWSFNSDPYHFDSSIFIVGFIFTLIFWILAHSLVDWLLEHTPLKTKELRKRHFDIKDEKKKEKNKIKLNNLNDKHFNGDKNNE